MELFQHIQAEIEKDKNVDLVIELLKQQEPEFRSIAYEATAMELAIQDLANGISLDKWYTLLEKSKEHDVHVHVGLGWALAKLQISPSKYIESLRPLLKWRVVDGMGYYFGLFNRRRTLIQCEFPELLEENAKAPFDQGVGRSIWYISKADPEQVTAYINNFSEGRHSNLWKGLGIAVTYVGGCTNEKLKLIYEAAGEHQKYLVCGATLACRARVFSKTDNESSSKVIQAWSNMNAEEACQLSIDKETDLEGEEGMEYEQWIQRIADSLKTRIK